MDNNIIQLIIKYKINKLYKYLNKRNFNKLTLYIHSIENAYKDCLNKIKVYYSDITRNSKNIGILGELIGFLNDKFNNININNYGSEISLLLSIINITENDKYEYLEKLKLYTTASKYKLQDFFNKIGYDLAIYIFVLTNKSLDINFIEIFELFFKLLLEKDDKSYHNISKSLDIDDISILKSLNKSSSNSRSNSRLSLNFSSEPSYSKKSKSIRRIKNKRLKIKNIKVPRLTKKDKYIVLDVIKSIETSKSIPNTIKLLKIIVNVNIKYKLLLIHNLKLIEKNSPELLLESSISIKSQKNKIPFIELLLPKTQLLLQTINLEKYRYLFESLKTNYNLFLTKMRNMYELSSKIQNYNLQKNIMNYNISVRNIYNISNLYIILSLLQNKNRLYKEQTNKSLIKRDFDLIKQKLLIPINFNTYILKYAFNYVKKLI
jgi:hypothetical protein